METAGSDCKYSQYVGGFVLLYTAACSTGVSNMNIFGVHTENAARVSGTFWFFCIADRYQVSGVRCSILRIILAVSGLLPVLEIECDNVRTLRVRFSQ